jgi:hypothetical protein
MLKAAKNPITKLSLKIPINNNISPIKLLVVGKLIFAKININKKIEYKGNKKATPP